MNDIARCDEKTKQLQITGNSPAEVALQALSMGYGKEALDVLRGISELQLKHEAENAKREFAIDMAQCQAEMPVVPKKGKNKQTNSMYAKQEDIVSIAKPIYTKFGFSISYYEEDSPKENHIRWCADVMHRSGHMVQRHVDIPIDDKGMQGKVNKTPTHAMKSSSTYGRGILICHIFNIPTSGDIDDDGNSAGGAEYISEDQQIEIREMVSEIYAKNPKAFWEFLKVKDETEILASDYKKVITTLNQAKENYKK